MTNTNSSQNEKGKYYASYKDSFVINLRKILNSYLKDNFSSISDLALNSNKDEQYIYGLNSFDKSYYESKFVVMMLNDYIGGGKLISIVFQNRPDRQFNAWIYKLADGKYELRTFTSSNIDPLEFTKTFPEEWKPFLMDKEHSI